MNFLFLHLTASVSDKKLSLYFSSGKTLISIWKKLGISTVLPGTYQILILLYYYLVTVPFLILLSPHLSEENIICSPCTSFLIKNIWGGCGIYNICTNRMPYFIFFSNRWFSAVYVFLPVPFPPFETVFLVGVNLTVYISRIVFSTHIRGGNGCMVKRFQWACTYHPICLVSIACKMRHFYKCVSCVPPDTMYIPKTCTYLETIFNS